MKARSTKLISIAVLTAASLGVASAAHAATDVYFSIGVPLYTQPERVYVQPRPVYVQPQPVYVEPRVEYRYEDRYEDGWRRGHGRHWQERRYARIYGPYGDIDGDGIRNQDDHDRDGDGVRNRYDRYPDNAYRR